MRLQIVRSRHLFPVMAFLTMLMLCLLVFLVLIFPFIGPDSQALKYVFITLGISLILLLIGAYLLLIFAYSQKSAGKAWVLKSFMAFFYPCVQAVGKLFHVNENVLAAAYIKFNNSLFLDRISNFDFQSLLVLLPHCLQSSRCPRRLTFSINNCALCGQCQIAEFVGLARKYGFKLAVAPGGTLARKIVREWKPDYIVAVACERDLYSGINDCFPLPVYGIFNQRPNGPCQDTCVSLELFKNTLTMLQAKTGNRQ